MIASIIRHGGDELHRLINQKIVERKTSRGTPWTR